MTQILAPCPGRLLPITEVDDPVFAQEMVGPGVAIDPDPGETTVEQFTPKGTVSDRPLDFFLERYAEAYRIELSAFVLALQKNTPMPVGAHDGRRALLLAEAAIKSLKSGKAEPIP